MAGEAIASANAEAMIFMWILRKEFERFDRLLGEARRGRVRLRMKAPMQAGQAGDRHDGMHRWM